MLRVLNTLVSGFMYMVQAHAWALRVDPLNMQTEIETFKATEHIKRGMSSVEAEIAIDDMLREAERFPAITYVPHWQMDLMIDKMPNVPGKSEIKRTFIMERAALAQGGAFTCTLAQLKARIGAAVALAGGGKESSAAEGERPRKEKRTRDVKPDHNPPTGERKLKCGTCGSEEHCCCICGSNKHTTKECEKGNTEP
jgi:hypothetical protein